ncbi:MAG: hypothetical protein ABR497_07040, partial [Kiritimatiellia bacterium]
MIKTNAGARNSFARADGDTGPVRFLSLCGMLGYGYAMASLERALNLPLDFIGVDAGSTDPGPYYLGSGNGFVKPAQVQRDLEPALCAAVKRRIPLIIGSAGGAGARPHLDAFVNILLDIAAKNNLHFKLAVIPADLDRKMVQQALAEGQISSCGGSGDLSAGAV